MRTINKGIGRSITLLKVTVHGSNTQGSYRKGQKCKKNYSISRRSVKILNIKLGRYLKKQDIAILPKKCIYI